MFLGSYYIHDLIVSFVTVGLSVIAANPRVAILWLHDSHYRDNCRKSNETGPWGGAMSGTHPGHAMSDHTELLWW